MAENVGFGSTYAIGTEVFAGLLSIEGPNPEVTVVPTSDLNDLVDTFIPGTINNGTVTITCKWNVADEGIIAAEALFVTPAIVTCKETTADGVEYSYPGIFQTRSFSPAPDRNTLATVAYTIQVCGAITINDD